MRTQPQFLKIIAFSSQTRQSLIQKSRLLIQILFVILFGQGTFAQDVRIDTLKFQSTFSPAPVQASELTFPIIKTGDRAIDSLINTDLRNRFTDNEYSDLPADSVLKRWAAGRIVELGFAITYMADGLISLNISAEGCGAHCSSWTDHFTYSTVTGRYISLNEIVDTSAKFRDLVIADRKKQYEEQRGELKKTLADKTSGLDDECYNWASKRYDECERSFKFGAFALFPDHLKIFENCDFPRAIRALTPVIELRYRYRDISNYLKIKQ